MNSSFPTSRAVIIDLPCQIVEGPRGIKLHLDATEIFPDDPGQGTPRLVELGRETMTLDCAMDNGGELDTSAKSAEDAAWLYAWLNRHYDRAGEWLDLHSKTAKPYRA